MVLLLADDRKDIVQGIAHAVDWAARDVTVLCAYNGQEALRLGLASRLVPEEQLQAETLALAEQLARMPTQAIARQKRLSYEFFYRDLAQFNLREADYMYETSRTPDYKEAVYAFLEKRKPEFTGQ